MIKSRCTDIHLEGTTDLDSLEKHVSALSLETLKGPSAEIDGDGSTKLGLAAPDLPGQVTLAMRKLREAIVASKRIDTFAEEVYKFIIRTTIMVKNMEAYHPALLYLLKTLHLRRPLSSIEFKEFSSYLVLDVACRQNDLNAAYATRSRFKLDDFRVENILHALARNDWVSFWKSRGCATVHQAKLLSWAEDRVRQHVSACLVKSYITAEPDFVKRSIGMTWREWCSVAGLAWQADGSNISLRRRPGA